MTTYVEVRGGTPGFMGSRGNGVQGTWTIHRSDCGKIAHRTWGVTTVAARDVGWALARYLRDDDGTHVCSCARGRDVEPTTAAVVRQEGRGNMDTAASTEHVVRADVIIGRVEGLSNSYGPGGYGVGIIPAGDEARRRTGGPIVPGPWGYLVGHASVIDTRGGTGRTHDEARAEGRWLDSIASGDVLVIGPDKIRMRLTVKGLGNLDLDPA